MTFPAPDWADRAAASVLRVRSGRGGGSAIAWQSAHDGTDLITNAHVVGRAKGVDVEDREGRVRPATLTAASHELDLAVLRVDSDVPPASLEDSRSLRLGTLAFALGHPWGRAWTLTRGVMSGLGEVGFGRAAPRELIRTDVRLAPGNSGGPLLSARGGVIGVNSMIWGGTLGVAVPRHVVSAWLASLRPGARLGVTAAPVRLPGTPQRPPTTAAILTAVEPGGRADRSDLRVGDVILGIDGLPVRSPAELRARLGMLDPGAGVTLDVWRAGARLDGPVVLAPDPRAA